MEKEEYVKRINEIMMNIADMPRFKGRAAYLLTVYKIKEIVEMHKNSNENNYLLNQCVEIIELCNSICSEKMEKQGSS